MIYTHAGMQRFLANASAAVNHRFHLADHPTDLYTQLEVEKGRLEAVVRANEAKIARLEARVVENLHQPTTTTPDGNASPFEDPIQRETRLTAHAAAERKEKERQAYLEAERKRVSAAWRALKKQQRDCECASGVRRGE